MSNFKCQIIPAILATSEKDYAEKLKKLESIKNFINGWVQIDLMDKKFVQNRSIGPAVIAKYPTEFKLEAHLMVEYPENWIDELVKIQSVTRIIFPVEDTEGVVERINHIKNHGVEVGLSVNPETPLSKIEPYTAMINVVLIMGVNPGFSGQEFIPETIEKIKETLTFRSGRNFKITVDGAVTEKNAKDLVNAGADILVIGNALFKYDNLEVGLKKIQEAIGEI